MLRRPSLSLAEVMWRFSFGATACVLSGMALIAYLDERTVLVAMADPANILAIDDPQLMKYPVAYTTEVS